MTSTEMQEAVARAEPLHRPRALTIAATRTILQVGFGGSQEALRSLAGRKFRAVPRTTEEGGLEVLTLQEVPRDTKARTTGVGVVSVKGKRASWHVSRPPAVKELFGTTRVNVAPSASGGALAYALEPPPPSARNPLGRGSLKRGEPRPSLLPAPKPAVAVSEDHIRSVLEQVRRIEEETSYRLSHDRETGRAIFVARID